ncbi:putative Gnk2-like domain-containing protein [Medicago truncatula]|uniref:Putative Gnk2-like domain-containing protein n=1 Tax=Medicago truncatula TaxID=3880 RepID=A0A072VPL0_MEDTR|nr:salt stress response/antifungal domain protein [Medicago truncatula]RHN82095.1 putative Gnk2-like domain-containing protein [Medicago truncatula]
MNEQDYEGPQVGRFNNLLWNNMNDIRNLTSNVPNGSMKYAYKSVNIVDNQKLYAMVYCVQYLSSDNCSWCLSNAISTSCCRGKIGGRVYFPSCGLRFEFYPFSYPLASWTTIQQPQLPTATVPLSTLAYHQALHNH